MSAALVLIEGVVGGDGEDYEDDHSYCGISGGGPGAAFYAKMTKLTSNMRTAASKAKAIKAYWRLYDSIGRGTSTDQALCTHMNTLTFDMLTKLHDKAHKK